MGKTSRKYSARMNKTSWDPDTKVRVRKDLRSTERPHKDNEVDVDPSGRGLLESDK